MQCEMEALTEPVKPEPVKMMNSVGNTEAYLPGQQTSGFDIPLYAAPVQPNKQEPVMWAYVDANDSFIDALNRQHGAYQTPLYAAPVDAKAIRAEALEEAAKHLAESGLIGSNDCAAAIRGLK